MFINQPVVADGSVGLVKIDSVVAGEDQNAAPAAAVARLDHEIRHVFDQLPEPLDLILIRDAADQAGGGDVVTDRQLLGAELVVHVRIVGAAVVAHDIGVVALVHAEHARLPQPARRHDRRKFQAEFHCFTSG